MSSYVHRLIDAIRATLLRVTVFEWFCYVAVIGMLALRCARPEIVVHEMALVIMLAIVITMCIRQLISFFSANSPFADPRLRNARSPIIMLRCIGCLLLAHWIFDWIPSLPREFQLEPGNDSKFLLNDASVCLGLVLVMMPAFKSASGVFRDHRWLLHKFIRGALVAFTGILVISAVIPVFLNLTAVFAIELAILNPGRMGSPNLTDENARNVANRLVFADMSLLSILATMTTVFGLHCWIGKKKLRGKAVMGLMVVASLATNTAFLIWVYHAGIQSLSAIPIDLAFYINGWHFARLILTVLVLVAIGALFDFGIVNGSTVHLTNGERNCLDLPRALYALVPLVWIVGSLFPVDYFRNHGFFFDNLRKPQELSGRNAAAFSPLFVEIWLLKIALAAICISKLNVAMLFRRSSGRFKAPLLIAAGFGVTIFVPQILDKLGLGLPEVVQVLGSIIVFVSFVTWSIVQLRRTPITPEELRRWNEAPNPYIGWASITREFWFLVPVLTFAAIVTLLAAIWSGFGIMSFTHWLG